MEHRNNTVIMVIPVLSYYIVIFLHILIYTPVYPVLLYTPVYPVLLYTPVYPVLLYTPVYPVLLYTPVYPVLLYTPVYPVLLYTPVYPVLIYTPVYPVLIYTPVYPEVKIFLETLFSITNCLMHESKTKSYQISYLHTYFVIWKITKFLSNI